MVQQKSCLCAQCWNYLFNRKEKTRIKPYLKDFKGISVREESSKELIKDIVDVSVQVVCDPVFLLSREMWVQKMKLTVSNENIFYVISWETILNIKGS